MISIIKLTPLTRIKNLNPNLLSNLYYRDNIVDLYKVYKLSEQHQKLLNKSVSLNIKLKPINNKIILSRHNKMAYSYLTRIYDDFRNNKKMISILFNKMELKNKINDEYYFTPFNFNIYPDKEFGEYIQDIYNSVILHFGIIDIINWVNSNEHFIDLAIQKYHYNKKYNIN